MGGSPHLQVQADLEASGILTGGFGNRDEDSARRIGNGDALPVPQEREQVVYERRVAEMDVHVAAVTGAPDAGSPLLLCSSRGNLQVPGAVLSSWREARSMTGPRGAEPGAARKTDDSSHLTQIGASLAQWPFPDEDPGRRAPGK